MSDASLIDAQAAVQDGGEQEPEMRMNRREFLNIAWLASLGFLVLEISGASLIFSYPRFKEGEFGGIVPFRMTDVPEAEAGPNNFPKVKIWLTNTPDGVMALYKVCPHLGCLFGWSDQEFKFICPCHGSQYENDGDWIEGPAPRSLDRFAFSIVDDQGQILAQSDDGSPTPLPDDPNAVIRVDTGKKILGENHA